MVIDFLILLPYVILSYLFSKIKSENHSKKTKINLNPNDRVVTTIIKGLLERKEKYGEIYCPCRVVTGNKKKDRKIICPCVYHKKEIKQQGYCLCRLFVK